MTAPLAAIARRISTLRSSRMLPGQGRCASSASAASVIVAAGSIVRRRCLAMRLKSSFRQGRQCYLDRIQAVEQVGAEAAGLDGFLQVRVGGGNELDIDCPAAGASDRADGPVV
jgi:hypothetical protein